jgi:hypothetical protein
MSKRQGKPSAPPPPTVKPAWDPEKYARETDSRIRLESSIPPSARPTVPPPGPEPVHMARGTDVPVLAISRDDLEWFELSSSSRDLLRQVNGRDTVEALATLLRVPPEQLLTDLEGLAREGLITWR